MTSTPCKAYDLCFHLPSGWAYDLDGADMVPPSASVEPAGWVGPLGPAIPSNSWPRGPVTGLPMAHAVTVRLPKAYRHRGEEYVAVSFFQGEGQFAEDCPATANVNSDDPFCAQLAEYAPHPMMELREDILEGQFALLWLTEDEYSGAHGQPPADVRRDGEHLDEDEGPNAWDHADASPAISVGLVVRDDPNAGLVEGDEGYTDPWPAGEERPLEMSPWALALIGRCHLGGTIFPEQGTPAGLTPFVLELEEFGPLNFGSGNCQIDLKSEAFDWACG